ncbi:MAG TPA: Fis family transcriptional regulator [Geobacter sp.]|nr:MAG: Fis family transcriptional regulator [Geobacteraceae bacterium GWF2_54_21]HCE67932.1 Fis family transcriptional regulator [Geobacter sp.]
MVSGKDTKLEENTELRRLAEEQLKAKSPETDFHRKYNETQRLFHELQVHQIELEMQNAELHQARCEIESALESYADIYDFTPVGYLTLDRDGTILAANLTAAGLLGIARSRLLGRRFGLFVADDIRQFFSEFLGKVFANRDKETCEVTLATESASTVFVHIEALAFSSGTECRVAVTDISERKRAEDELLRAHNELELRVTERTQELNRINEQLILEIEEHKRSVEQLLIACQEISRLKELFHAENVYLQQDLARKYNFGEITGQSESMSFVFAQIDQVAPMNATVLLLGETGSGKGVVARAIHRRSSRKERPLITVNCTALPANLFESELFGREKGAFTGADARQIGRFELANGGTIFLDEIGEMPMELQCKLLRVIQDGEFERLGSPHTIKTDVRIIAASNRNLEEEIKNGTFREDLFYRLNVFPIKIPPLRQRKEDIPLLVNHFVAKFNKKMGNQIEIVPKDTLTELQGYRWPGNVRELESVIERAVIISQGKMLQVLDSFETYQKAEEPSVFEIKSLEELEQDHILRVLQKTGWRIEGEKGAAVLLGLNPSTLRARMRKFGIARQ